MLSQISIHFTAFLVKVAVYEEVLKFALSFKSHYMLLLSFDILC